MESICQQNYFEALANNERKLQESIKDEASQFSLLSKLNLLNKAIPPAEINCFEKVC